MPDIFVSYAHQDRDWAARFTDHLAKVGGWDVWWDRSILPGEQFDDAIQSALENARCVVVIWSKESAGSRWVRTEARDAADRQILVPVRIDDVSLPLEFRSFEAEDLSAWSGDPQNSDFLELVAAVRIMLEAPARPAPGPGEAGGERSSHPLLGEPEPDPHRIEPASANRSAPKPTALSPRAIGASLLVAAMLIVAVAWLSRKPAVNASPPLPHFTYGTWTLRNAFDDDRRNWSNSALKFTGQEEAPDGLLVRGTLTWRLDDVLMGTEDFAGHYVAASRQLFLEGTSVKDVPHAGADRLATGSYSAVVSPDERTLRDGRWGVTATDLPGASGRWEADR